MNFEDTTSLLETSQEFTITTSSGSLVKEDATPAPKLVQSVEDFRNENKKLIEVIKATNTAIKNSVVFPDLWNEHSKVLTTDVSSKEDFLQIPRHLRFITSLESAYKNDLLKRMKKDIN